MNLSLKNQVALVTGASSGLGYACAEALAKEEAAVVINYHSQAEPAEELAEKIRAGGGRAIAVKATCRKRQMSTISLRRPLLSLADWTFWWLTQACRKMPPQSI